MSYFIMFEGGIKCVNKKVLSLKCWKAVIIVLIKMLKNVNVKKCKNVYSRYNMSFLDHSDGMQTIHVFVMGAHSL